MKKYILNMETGKIELRFVREDYERLPLDLKKELKNYYLWKKSEQIWVSKAKEPNLQIAVQVAGKLGFKQEERQGERISYEEQLRRKAERAEQRAERYREYAVNAEGRGAAMQHEFNQNHGDLAWLTQPVLAGHTGSERFGRQRQKIMDRYEKGVDEYRKSEYFRQKAKNAEDTASMKILKNPVYLQKRIKETKSEIKGITGSIQNNKMQLEKIQNGEAVKRYDGSVYTLEEIKKNLTDNMERLAVYTDKQAFFEKCLDEIGIFSNKN